MTKKNGPLDSFKKWLSKDQDGNNQKLTKNHYLIILLVVGIAFMIFSSFLTKDNNESSNPIPVSSVDEDNEEIETLGKSNRNEPSSIAEFERYYENQIREALESVIGVEDVTIVVNVDSTERKIYEKNVTNKKQVTDETDTNGGKRKVEDHSIEEQMVLIREGDKEIPLISEVKKPKIRGVLVVAKGADNIHVKKSIVEAVMRTLDVQSHRVSVLAKK